MQVTKGASPARAIDPKLNVSTFVDQLLQAMSTDSKPTGAASMAQFGANWKDWQGITLLAGI